MSKVPGSCNSLVSKVPGSRFKSAITLWKSKINKMAHMDISYGTRMNWLMIKNWVQKICWDYPFKCHQFLQLHVHYMYMHGLNAINSYIWECGPEFTDTLHKRHEFLHLWMCSKVHRYIAINFNHCVCMCSSVHMHECSHVLSLLKGTVAWDFQTLFLELFFS